jgi:hypothetical protein
VEPKFELLRHTLATLSYRGGKCLKDAPVGFSDFQLSSGTRTPGQILAHIGDLFDWALSLVEGAQRWHETAPATWEQDCARFFAAMESLDRYLVSGKPVGGTPEELFQGPIADAFTHIGQIALMRRLAAAPVRPENYHKAKIAAGRVGPEQAKPVLEF